MKLTTTVSGGAKSNSNSLNSNNTGYGVVSEEKQSTLNSKKDKSAFGKTAPLVSPPPIMNHVTGHYRRNEENPQNNQNEVEEIEMDTQDGKLFVKFLIKIIY